MSQDDVYNVIVSRFPQKFLLQKRRKLKRGCVFFFLGRVGRISRALNSLDLDKAALLQSHFLHFFYQEVFQLVFVGKLKFVC